MINNRQSSSRRRGRGSSNQRSSGGSSSGQRDSGNRIDSRARGNAAQLLEKYKNMARDAQMQGDRVNTEYYLQFADHYFRVLSDGRSRSEDQRPQHQSGGVDNFDANNDDDYGDEGEPIRAGEQSQQREDDGNRDGNRTARDDGNRNDSQRRDYAPRDDGRQNGQTRDYAPRDDNRQSSQNRDYQNRDYQPRDAQTRDQPRETQGRDQQSGDRNASRDQQPRDDARRDDQRTAPAVNGHAPYRNGAGSDRDAAPAQQPETTERKPSSRTRKPTTAAAPASDPTPTFDADRLPPSLGIAAVTEGAGDDAEKPKKRRGRPPASAAPQPN